MNLHDWSKLEDASLFIIARIGSWDNLRWHILISATNSCSETIQAGPERPSITGSRREGFYKDINLGLVRIVSKVLDSIVWSKAAQDTSVSSISCVSYWGPQRIVCLTTCSWQKESPVIANSFLRSWSWQCQILQRVQQMQNLWFHLSDIHLQ